MTLIELLEFLAPFTKDLDIDDKQAALDIAAEYRPSCLSKGKQDEAQAFYAAYLLYAQGQRSSSTPITARTLKEGDLSVTFGSTSDAMDPMGFYAGWAKLAKQCSGGAITVGRAYGGRC